MHQATHLSLPVDPTDHAIGPHDSRVTVVEYGDFECPICKQAAPAIRLLLNHFKGRIRFVYRHFPLEEIHPHALGAAEAAEGAGAQGKFWPMHDLLFDNQPRLKPPQLRNYAEQLQIDGTRFAAEMDDHLYLQRVREQMASGHESGVRSTPAFFVNGKVQDVSFGMEALFKAVEVILRT
jgi:protein-disulfide isomerase